MGEKNGRKNGRKKPSRCTLFLIYKNKLQFKVRLGLADSGQNFFGSDNSNTTAGLLAVKSEIAEAIETSGFDIPSPYTDMWFDEVYPPAEAQALKEVYGCPNGPDGETVDCYAQGFKYYCN